MARFHGMHGNMGPPGSRSGKGRYLDLKPVKEKPTSRGRYQDFRTASRIFSWFFDRRNGEVETNGTSADQVNPPPADAAPPSPDSRKYLRLYFNWLWPYRRPILGQYALSETTMLLGLVQPLVMGLIIDQVLSNTKADYDFRMQRLTLYCLGLLAVLLIGRVIDTYQGYAMVLLNSRIVVGLRRRLHQRLIHLPIGDLVELKTGGVVSRLSSDVDRASGFLSQAVFSPSLSIQRVIYVEAILIWINWRLAVVTAVAIPLMVLVSLVWIRKIKPIYRSISIDRSRTDARATETFTGIRVVRSFRREAKERREYALGHHTMIRKRLLATFVEQSIDALWETINPGVALAILAVGGVLVIKGVGTIGQITATTAYATGLLWPIMRIISSLHQVQESLASIERVFDILQRQPDKPDAPDAIAAPRDVREIRLDQVNFEYRPGVPVIQDMNLVIPGGATVALVGPSGAGKSTLTDLIARFHDPTTGIILLNGIDIRRFQLRTYRSLLAVVQQEVFLFDGTVGENIAYGKRHATGQEIENAARRANAHGFIAELPEGYDTFVGERGLKLSGGQRQRLSIARAILADPQVLILDEATSNLDTQSEQLIQSALMELFANRTTLVIAHRLSTVSHADLIVVVDKGRIVEAGNHDQLMNAGGMYYDMVERQRKFSDATTDAVG